MVVGNIHVSHAQAERKVMIYTARMPSVLTEDQQREHQKIVKTVREGICFLTMKVRGCTGQRKL